MAATLKLPLTAALPPEMAKWKKSEVPPPGIRNVLMPEAATNDCVCEFNVGLELFPLLATNGSQVAKLTPRRSVWTGPIVVEALTVTVESNIRISTGSTKNRGGRRRALAEID